MRYKYDSVRLEKGMYSDANKSFTQVLESLDPSENYRGTPLEGLDAFQRQLKRFDIEVKGTHSDPVEKFFRTSESAILFPEYVSRAVNHGMEESSLLNRVVTSVTDIDKTDHNNASVNLHKHGRILTCSYKSVRFQKLDLFSVILRQIGSHIVHTQMDDAVNVLFENSDVLYGKLSYASLADLCSKFEPYTMNTMIVSTDVAVQMMDFSKPQNPIVELDFQSSRNLVTFCEAKLIRTNALSEKTAIGLDNRFALEMVQSGRIAVDYDRLIDRKFEHAAITAIAGFAKIFPEATKVLEIA